MKIVEVTESQQNLDEFKIFGKTDNASVKEQDPNKIKVLSWIADRTDGKEHFLSFFRKGAAWSGRLLYINPDQAKKFINALENHPDQMARVKRALTSIETASKLFKTLGIKHQIRRAD